MLTREAKEKMLKEITENLKEADLVVVTDYRGLNVEAINTLRGRLKEVQCDYRVTKNTMNRMACREVGLQELEPLFEGPTAIAYSDADPVAAAKVFADFIKENENLVIKGGLLSGQMLDQAEIKSLGEIPSREVLLAKIVGGFQSPITGLVGALQGTVSQLVYAVDAVRRQQESA